MILPDLTGAEMLQLLRQTQGERGQEQPGHCGGRGDHSIAFYNYVDIASMPLSEKGLTKHYEAGCIAIEVQQKERPNTSSCMA